MVSIQPLTHELLDRCFDSFVQTLAGLSHVGDLTHTTSHEVLDRLHQSVSQIFVMYDDEQKIICGTITVLIEPVFWRGGSSAGHIENLVVHSDYQGQGLARTLILEAISYAKQKKCYKILLNCSHELQKFYEKFGFEYKEYGMKMYI